MEPCITISDLSYRYPDGTHALNELNLTIPLHSRTAILGANGCGKSTLIRHLNGLIVPQSGSIRIGDRELTKKTADDIRRSVGLLFDNPDNQIFSPSVEADVGFGPTNLKMKKDEIARRTDEAIRTVEIEPLRKKSPYNLSLGQKKRCAIAGVLAMEPEIVLMDEPFSGLDPASLQQFLGTLDRLTASGVTEIMSTHDVDIAYEWAEYVVVMERGHVLASGGKALMQDAALMKSAHLELPLLVRLFSGTGEIPDSFAHAQSLLAGLSAAKKSENGRKT